MSFLEQRDIPIWRAAAPWLDVRSNDAHTLISYRMAQALLRLHSEADASIVLPAILLHDVGWKRIPAEKLIHAVGPNPKYPELQREHEIQGAAIARAELDRLMIAGIDVRRVIDIIDGHDTRKHALSLEDALMKDADKLWRFTAHGIATIGGWFGSPAKDTIAMLGSFVLPTLLTVAGSAMAEGLLAAGDADAWINELLELHE